MPDNNSSKTNWVQKLNKPLEYSQGWVFQDPFLAIKEFDEEMRMEGERISKIHQDSFAAKEAENLRRHDEKVAVMKEQVHFLSELLKDSKNAIEQRNAIIHFMVEELIKSDQPNETKKRLLMDLLVPIATVSSGAGDLMQLVKDALESIS